MGDAAAPPPRRAPRWLREPLLWFLAVGAVLFWLAEQEEAGGSTIVIDQAVLQRLNDQWQAQMGRSASDAELNGLIDDWLKEEIYSREALNMGLDENDTIIRRRLVQKLKFLTEDLALSSEPTPQTTASPCATTSNTATSVPTGEPTRPVMPPPHCAASVTIRTGQMLSVIPFCCSARSPRAANARLATCSAAPSQRR